MRFYVHGESLGIVAGLEIRVTFQSQITYQLVAHLSLSLGKRLSSPADLRQVAGAPFRGIAEVPGRGGKPLLRKIG
jgi:hypothetical protein